MSLLYPTRNDQVYDSSLENDQSITLESGIRIVESGEAVKILNPQAIIYDCDETYVKKTVEKIHDGIGGKFHHALSALLISMGEKADIYLKIEESWDSFSEAFGIQQDAGCRVMIESALSSLPLKDKTRNLLAGSTDVYSQKLQVQIGEYFQRLDEDDIRSATKPSYPLLDLARYANSKGTKNSVCSGSPVEFVSLVNSAYHISDVIDYCVGNAQKCVSKENYTYSGDPFLEICEVLNINPALTVAVGDGLSEVAAAILSNLDSVIIRFPTENFDVSYNKFIRDYSQWKMLEGIQGETRTKVFIVRDSFSQILLDYSSDQALSVEVIRNPLEIQAQV